ncbi:hypothetical protein OI25_139 [Paraburkholderia fungorum]|jgi:hypothetical protein|uniref:DUF6566 domain-containing protein n=1 Tax=Paraburkholderia fungorum TaxID=134537 RepID=A0AAU8SXQ1_9BURK|nr:hypothetical protein OI25_139 [Paraburkholderia fungorum]
MQTHVFEHRGYEIVVQPAQNADGLPPLSWRGRLLVKREKRKTVLNLLNGG